MKPRDYVRNRGAFARRLTIGRWILTLGLLVGVYSETGFFTTLVLLLIAVRFEMEE